MMANILIIDENRSYCDQLHKMVCGKGYQASRAYSLQEGCELNRLRQMDVVVVNNRLANGDGICHLLQMFRNGSAEPEVLVMAEPVNSEEAEQAIQHGAWDYIAKPGVPYQIVRPLDSIVKYRRLARRPEPAPQPERPRPAGIVGGSRALRNSLALLDQAAHCQANVLITGETGTGKELFATAIHQQSERAGRSLVVVDCTALPETLVESTLFGHEKGAFTGAVRRQDGLIKQADGGTLFLDEVGELPLALQKSFLRVLETGRFRPVGANVEHASDFRLVAATNQDLGKMVKADGFRADLLFRLRTFSIELPALRCRPEDITELCRYFSEKMSRHTGVAPKELADEFAGALRRYHWPGNVRELFHALERSAAAAGEEAVLFTKHLPTYIRVSLARSNSGDGGCQEKAPKDAGAPLLAQSLPPDSPLPSLQQFRDHAVDLVEKQYLREVASQTGGDVAEACRIAGVSRSRFYALLKKHQLRCERNKEVMWIGCSSESQSVGAQSGKTTA